MYKIFFFLPKSKIQHKTPIHSLASTQTAPFTSFSYVFCSSVPTCTVHRIYQ